MSYSRIIYGLDLHKLHSLYGFNDETFAVGRQISDEDVAEDLAAYRATLQEALDKKLSIVSLRHSLNTCC